MSFVRGQIVQATRSIPFGKASKIPKGVKGRVVKVKGLMKKTYTVEFVSNQYGKVEITAPEGNFRGTYSF